MNMLEGLLAVAVVSVGLAIVVDVIEDAATVESAVMFPREVANCGRTGGNRIRRYAASRFGEDGLGFNPMSGEPYDVRWLDPDALRKAFAGLRDRITALEVTPQAIPGFPAAAWFNPPKRPRTREELEAVMMGNGGRCAYGWRVAERCGLTSAV